MDAGPVFGSWVAVAWCLAWVAAGRAALRLGDGGLWSVLPGLAGAVGSFLPRASPALFSLCGRCRCGFFSRFGVGASEARGLVRGSFFLDLDCRCSVLAVDPLWAASALGGGGGSLHRSAGLGGHLPSIADAVGGCLSHTHSLSGAVCAGEFRGGGWTRVLSLAPGLLLQGVFRLGPQGLRGNDRCARSVGLGQVGSAVLPGGSGYLDCERPAFPRRHGARPSAPSGRLRPAFCVGLKPAQSTSWKWVWARRSLLANICGDFGPLDPIFNKHWTAEFYGWVT